MARAADNKAKNQKMAADLIGRGYPHGRRASKACTNSGGLDKRQGVVGSAAHQRATGQVPAKVMKPRRHKRPA